MTRTRVAGALIGIVFGATLSWTGMIDPNVIREALLFENGYLFMFFGSAVGTAAVGLFVLRRVQKRALLLDVALTWVPQRPERRHVVGALIFGIGWGVADACPGPILAQVGQGMPWGMVTLIGAVAGVFLYLRQGTKETEPAVDKPAANLQSARPSPAESGSLA